MVVPTKPELPVHHKICKIQKTWQLIRENEIRSRFHSRKYQSFLDLPCDSANRLLFCNALIQDIRRFMPLLFAPPYAFDFENRRSLPEGFETVVDCLYEMNDHKFVWLFDMYANTVSMQLEKFALKYGNIELFLVGLALDVQIRSLVLGNHTMNPNFPEQLVKYVAHYSSPYTKPTFQLRHLRSLTIVNAVSSVLKFISRLPQLRSLKLWAPFASIFASADLLEPPFVCPRLKELFFSFLHSPNSFQLFIDKGHIFFPLSRLESFHLEFTFTNDDMGANLLTILAKMKALRKLSIEVVYLLDAMPNKSIAEKLLMKGVNKFKGFTRLKVLRLKVCEPAFPDDSPKPDFLNIQSFRRIFTGIAGSINKLILRLHYLFYKYEQDFTPILDSFNSLKTLIINYDWNGASKKEKLNWYDPQQPKRLFRQNRGVLSPSTTTLTLINLLGFGQPIMESIAEAFPQLVSLNIAIDSKLPPSQYQVSEQLLKSSLLDRLESLRCLRFTTVNPFTTFPKECIAKLASRAQADRPVLFRFPIDQTNSEWQDFREQLNHQWTTIELFHPGIFSQTNN